MIENLFRAASTGDWSEVPPELQILESMSLRDSSGCTVTMLAARHGTLGRVPAGLLTPESMCERHPGFLPDSPYMRFRVEEVFRDSIKDTIPDGLRQAIKAHLRSDRRPIYDRLLECAETGVWDHIPENLLTPENALLTGQRGGGNILSIAARVKRLRFVPGILLTEEALMAKEDESITDRDLTQNSAMDVGLLKEWDSIPFEIVDQNWDGINAISTAGVLCELVDCYNRFLSLRELGGLSPIACEEEKLMAQWGTLPDGFDPMWDQFDSRVLRRWFVKFLELRDSGSICSKVLPYLCDWWNWRKKPLS